MDVRNDKQLRSLLKAERAYLLVETGALVLGVEVLVPLSQPTSAKQATSANKDSIFIVLCISFSVFAFSCLGRLALRRKFTKCRMIAKHYFNWLSRSRG